MSDISKINVDGVDYDVKDVTARTSLDNKCQKGIVSLKATVSTNDSLNTFIDNLYNTAGDGNMSVGRLELSVSGLNLPGGSWLVIVSNDRTTYGFALALRYGTEKELLMYSNCKTNGEWKGWQQILQLPQITTSDNGKVLKVVNGVWTAVAE